MKTTKRFSKNMNFCWCKTLTNFKVKTTTLNFKSLDLP